MLAGVTPQWLRGMFSHIAQRYDLTNTIISAGLDHAWRRHLAQRVSRHAARLILDVACGTGGVMVQLARCCPPTTRLIGVDFTEAMLSGVVSWAGSAWPQLHRRLACISALGMRNACHTPIRALM